MGICYSSYEECTICLDKIYFYNNYNLTCGHIFHKKCIKNWLKKNNECPICRKFQYTIL